MKKIFNFALVALAVAAVSCNKTPEVVKPVATLTGDAAFTDGKANITVTLDKANPNADTKVTLALDAASTLTSANVTIPKALTVKAGETTKSGIVLFNEGELAAGTYTAVVKATEADNNATIGTPNTVTITVTVEEKVAPAPTWDYVMNISDYKTNSEFHFGKAIQVNPNNMTFQWKFYSTKWNDYDKVDEERGYKVWANRLGQISNSGEKGMLFRFNDGHEKGSLRFNAAVLGNDGKDYVQVEGKDYIWSLNTWHTLTVTADGTTVSIYDNADLIMSYEQNTPEVFAQWPIERFDISMTWDDGTGYDKGQAFLGYIAYTRLWGKALTAGEVAASLCNAEANDDLLICWNWDLSEGTVVANAGKAGADYDLDFTKALAGGQASYVKAEDIAGAWTDVTEVEGLAPVCAE
jgi:hypothetical protein